MVLYRFDGKSLSKIVEKNGDNDYQIFRAMEDNAGNIWFGTMQGICRYDGKTVTHFLK